MVKYLKIEEVKDEGKGNKGIVEVKEGGEGEYINGRRWKKKKKRGRIRRINKKERDKHTWRKRQ